MNSINQRRCVNTSNLQYVSQCPINNNYPVFKSTTAYLPNFLSTNIRSLFPKMDEFALLLDHLCIDIAAVSETWLHEGIENDILSIPNYNLVRQDRSVGRGGGVCAFVSNSIPYKRWTDLENPLYECLWLSLRPHRLPRKISCIVMGILYSPPDKSAQDQRDTINYLIETLDHARNKFPDCGIVLVEDFNNLDISDLLTGDDLNQIICEPTRGSAILDLVITNLQQFYKKPLILAPVGTSDHSVINWCPDDSSFRPRGKVIKRQRRFFPQSQLEAFGRWLTSHDWNLVSSEGSVEELVSDFTARITQAMDTFFPIQTVKLHSNDKPWMSVSIKQLIIARQQAFSCGNIDLWRHYKGKVKHAIQLKKRISILIKYVILKRVTVDLCGN